MGRKEQVLHRLQNLTPADVDGWVNGTALANEEVGGSEGLKRLRELRAEGWPIEERKHPDQRRAIWQYRLRRGALPTVPVEEKGVFCPKCGVRVIHIFMDEEVLAPDYRWAKCVKHGRVIVKVA